MNRAGPEKSSSSGQLFANHEPVTWAWGDSKPLLTSSQEPLDAVCILSKTGGDEGGGLPVHV